MRGGAESPFQICLLNPTTIPNATVVGLPFIFTIVQLPKGWSLGLLPLVVRHAAFGRPSPITGDLAEVRIISRQLQADLDEEGANVVNVIIYNTGSCSPSFNMMPSVMSIVTLPSIPRILLVSALARLGCHFPDSSHCDSPQTLQLIWRQALVHIHPPVIGPFL